jgi:hypothetical protein
MHLFYVVSPNRLPLSELKSEGTMHEIQLRSVKGSKLATKPAAAKSVDLNIVTMRLPQSIKRLQVVVRNSRWQWRISSRDKHRCQETPTKMFVISLAA